jgi:tRNA pseudouridine32 synthase / 23S rRNA pseudouridine746 synthase
MVRRQRPVRAQVPLPRHGWEAPADAAALPVARVLHRDESVLILDKPAGLAVHRGPGGGRSLEDWLPLLRFGKRRDPQPAHRLDADTAGCLVLGRTKPALALLGALFAEGRVEKVYWAVVRGRPEGDSGLIEAPLRKVSSAARGWRTEVHSAGQAARTEWRVLGAGDGLAWLELRPRTGRTHQLRVHCAHLGCPILGDARYGGGSGPLHLLARSVALPLDPPVRAVAEPPEAMRDALRACGWTRPRLDGGAPVANNPAFGS